MSEEIKKIIEDEKVVIEEKKEIVEEKKEIVEEKKEIVEKKEEVIDKKEEKEQTIPYDRFKEVNDKYKDMKKDFDDLMEKFSGISDNTKKEKEELENKIQEISKEKEDMIIDSFNSNDKDYLKFLIDKKQVIEGNEGKDLKEIIKEIKSESPQIFNNSSTPGSNNGSDNSSKVISIDDYNGLEKEERMKINRKINSGEVVVI